MMAPGSRFRQIGWAMTLGLCVAGFGVLTFQVNAVKSRVALAERQIIALEREKLVLETEFQARANQQQLADWNRVEFGYLTPAADQYLDSERQLAALGMERGTDAPEPVRLARPVDKDAGEGSLLAMVSPLTGQPFGAGDVVDDRGSASGSASASASASASDRPSGESAGAGSSSLSDRLTSREPVRRIVASTAE